MKRVLGFVGFILSTVVLLPILVVYCLGGPAVMKPGSNFHGEDVTIRVFLHEENRVADMSLEEYVKGVVAAEMPAEFELEALKSQAVAARTYAVKNMTAFGGAGLADRPGADVSTDSRVSQAWQSNSQLKARWGAAGYELYRQKISRAVDETRGLILVYDNEPINALFHSTSGERTASAKEVWGFDYPYLQSVACPWDKKSPRYSDSKEYSLAELEQRLGADVGVVAAAQGGGGAVAQVIDRTESGRVDKIRLGGKIFTGYGLRQKLELRSANFTVDFQGEKAIFRTVGYGHGVGLCQYGANGMAKEGRSYKDILTYYYTGVTLKNIFGS